MAKHPNGSSLRERLHSLLRGPHISERMRQESRDKEDLARHLDDEGVAPATEQLSRVRNR